MAAGVAPTVEALGRMWDRGADEGEAYAARRRAKGKHVAATVYDAPGPAEESVAAQLRRWWVHAGVTEAQLLAAGLYIDRFVSKTRVPLTPLNKHRLLMCALLCAHKWLQDEKYSMSAYAGVAGTAPKTLSSLERAFLRDIDFHLFVEREELARYEGVVAAEIEAMDSESGSEL